jgi:predicted dithiol-disulfide oxidoreductase (DUF899 family)
MGGGPDHIKSERDLIKKVSGGKLDEAIDYSSDFELFDNRRILSLLNKLDSRSGSEEFAQLENEGVKQYNRLAESKREARREKVADYKLNSTSGPIALSSLFGAHNDLLMVHNMGQSCGYCTMWADGFNGIYPHLANRAGFAPVSPDPRRARCYISQAGF